MKKFADAAASIALAVSTIILAMMAPFVLLFWWIQSNWGVDAAGAVALAGGLILAAIVGWGLNYWSTRKAMHIAGEMAHDMAHATSKGSGVETRLLDMAKMFAKDGKSAPPLTVEKQPPPMIEGWSQPAQIERADDWHVVN